MNTRRKQIIGWMLLIFPVLGFFFRSYQLRYELLFDGSLTDGAFVHDILLILTLCYAIGCALLLLRLKKLSAHRQCFTKHRLFNTLQMIAALGLFLGNLLLWIGGREPASLYTVADSMATLLPILGIVSACCLFSFALLCIQGRKPSALLYMIGSLYLVVRLVVCFQEWNADPSVHDYAYQLLAVICCMLGSFQLAGFGFDKGKRRMTLFWTLCAVFFCGITVADTFGNAAEMLINLALLASMALSSVQLLFANEDAPAVEEAAQESPAAKTEE